MRVEALRLPEGFDAFGQLAAFSDFWGGLLEDPQRKTAVLFSQEGEAAAFGLSDGACFATHLRKLLDRTDAGLPPAPLAVGYLAYEAGRWFERLPAPKGELAGPVGWLHCPRVAVRIDGRKALVCAHDEKVWQTARALLADRALRAFPSLRWHGTIKARSSAKAYCHAVQKARAAIARGEIFQANIARFFSMPFSKADALATYGRLRMHNPAPFSGYLSIPMGDDTLIVMSSSPERLLHLSADRIVQTRPIAGTRRRGESSREDAALADELLLSEKERAEHVMLVDLARNDLGRVASPGSVHVDEMMVIERYATVQHIVSNVRAHLRADCDHFDAIRAVFPGGTITGCPKVRCMEIIHQLEPGPRGPYTGSLGWLACNGAMDWNILIRTCWWWRNELHWAAGAGIVADSEPEKELIEVAHKAAGIERALGLLPSDDHALAHAAMREELEDVFDAHADAADR